MGFGIKLFGKTGTGTPLTTSGVYEVGLGRQFTTIQTAINQARSDGHTDANNPAIILIYPGSYVENLTLQPGLTLTNISGDLDFTVKIDGAHTFSMSTGIISNNIATLIGINFINSSNSASTIAVTGTAPLRLKLYACQISMGNDTVAANPTILMNNSGSGSSIALNNRVGVGVVSRTSPTGDAVQIMNGALISYGIDFSSVGGNALLQSGGTSLYELGTLTSTSGNQVVSIASGTTVTVVLCSIVNSTSGKDGINCAGGSVSIDGNVSFNIAGAGYCARGTGTFLYAYLAFFGANSNVQNTLSVVAINTSFSLVP